MDVQVGLTMFAANENNLTNSYILLKEGQEENGCLKIPAMTLPDDLDSVSIAYQLLYECTGITGRWAELRPQQVGAFDDVGRNPDKREIVIVYSIFIPQTIKILKGYRWVKLDELNEHKLYLDTEDIIRYSVLGGNRYVV